MSSTFAIAFATGLLIAWLLLRFEYLHVRVTGDAAYGGPQKFHSRSTPRIGGIPVAAGFLAGSAAAVTQGAMSWEFLVAMSLTMLPAYASGILEDLTKRLGPDMRLWASFLSALLALYFFDAAITRSGITFVDRLLAWYPFALVVTMVAVGGVAHAVNIIDGYNGLAGVVSLLMHGVLAVVAWQVGDRELAATSLALMGGTVGFLFFNFPRGRLFAGDGGAYLWGVSVALVGVLLIHRNPAVSPLLPLLVVIYPVFETLFTVYRRTMKHSTAPGMPDARHLHQLIYRRLLATPGRTAGLPPQCAARRNAATSPFLWALASLSLLPALVFWKDTGALAAATIAFCVVYTWLYRAIVCFEVPGPLWRLSKWIAATVVRDRARVSAEQQHP